LFLFRNVGFSDLLELLQLRNLLEITINFSQLYPALPVIAREMTRSIVTRESEKHKVATEKEQTDLTVLA